jgi:hypothetical protein
MLRRQAMEVLQQSGRLHSTVWLSSLLCKMKKDEYAKPNKPPRSIGDLGVEASLAGFRLTQYLKYAMRDNPIKLKDSVLQFVATPTPKDLRDVFRKLINPPDRGYFCYFSDDSCLALREEDGSISQYNVDISSCDTSHCAELFEALISIIPEQFQDDMRRIVDQLRKNVRIHSLVDPNIVLILSHIDPILFSGSTITTAINNLASMLIGYEMLHCGSTDPADLVKAAEKVGYIVTLEKCKTIYDIQFLKHSPIIDNEGEIQPFINLGVWFRASGVCRQELPGKGSFDTRMRSYQGALIQGMFAHYNFPLKDNLLKPTLKPQDCHVKKVREELRYKVETEPVLARDGATISFSTEQCFARYELTSDEISFIQDEWALCGPGMFCAHPALGKILMKDYGLDTVILDCPAPPLAQS